MTERQRGAAIALGICVISLVFIVETVLAHRQAPNPLSPLVWTVLGTVAAASLGVYLRLTWLEKRR
jgi:multisubunit Na+/H+ antiporter MnhB subunit